MNREMQSKLVTVLRDAMNAQGIMQSDIARHIGTSSGMVSQAFSCKGQMRDERWRMCCELCGVDFDRFMEAQQHEVGQRPTNESECSHSPSVASAGLVPVMAEPEQSRAEQTEPVQATEKEGLSMECTIRELDCSLKTALTTDQCRCLAELINNHLCDAIKDNPLVDFHYIKDMINAHDVLINLWASDDKLPCTLEIIPAPREHPFDSMENLTDE